MPEADRPYDVTGQVPLDDPEAVACAVDGILAGSFGEGRFDQRTLHDAFGFVGRVFAGDDPRWLACDLPYHDLRHSLDAALTTARLVDGLRRADVPGAATLTPELGLTAVLLALLHDSGFLRTAAESALVGPRLAATHEMRSVAFAEGFLRTTRLAPHAGLAPLIMATRVACAPASVLEGCAPAHLAIARMVGSADLLCQMADPLYLERCYHHLYPELVLGGGDRRVTADGGCEMLFRSGRDLVACTPGFHRHVVAPRLTAGFGNVAQHLAAHFGGADPYAATLCSNLERCGRIVDGNRWDLLGSPPPTTTPSLDAAYFAAASGD